MTPDHSALIERLEERVAYDKRHFTVDPLHAEAAVALRDLTEWRDIATAPKDGTMILVGYDDNIAKKARLDVTQRVYEARWDERQGSFVARNGFIMHCGATHWLPLPSAPNQAKEAGE